MTIRAVFLRWGLLLLGVVLVIAGLTVASPPATFGWFGYAPLGPSLVVMHPGAFIALGFGVALIAGSVGFILGSWARKKEQP